MTAIVNQNVPICPVCASGMHKRYNIFGCHYICIDNNHVFRVLGTNKAENEIVVTDNVLEEAQYKGGKV